MYVGRYVCTYLSDQAGSRRPRVQDLDNEKRERQVEANEVSRWDWAASYPELPKALNQGVVLKS